MAEIPAPRFPRRKLFLLALLAITGILIGLALILPFIAPLATTPLREGDVAPQDILAPYTYAYESAVLTEAQRQQAAAQAPLVYDPADPAIARQQLERLQSALAFIASVRADAYASGEQKLTDLAALEDIQLSQETAARLLALSDSRWQTVHQEAILVLEQVMRSTIRTDQLEDVRRGVPALVSLSIPADQAAIIAELVKAFVVPNSFYNPDLTEAARKEAAARIPPVIREYQLGQTIVQRGQIITPAVFEALEQFGLVQAQSRWQDFLSALCLAALTCAFFAVYFQREAVMLADLRGLTLMAVLFLTFLYAARLSIPGHTILPYAFPVMAFSLTVATLFGPAVAWVLTFPLAILVTYRLPMAFELTIFYVLSSFFGIIVLRRAERLTRFFWAGGVIALVGAATVLIYRLLQSSTDLIGLATLVGAAAFNGLASASVSVLLQFALAQMLGLTTALQLIELSRPDHPLLQFILRNAPGTYQHSLLVANLAEQAAEAIGADIHLTHVGALYHDAGKALNPAFFIENQPPGSSNPHDALSPYDSAAIILRHVTDGLELARKYRLPRRVQQFITEHHGSLVARYQYVRAVREAGGDESRVDIERFRYRGQRPQSRETALLMLADSCEARVRAERPPDEASLRALIQKLINERVTSGELIDSGLTLKDLNHIVEAFTNTLRGVYHPRLEYPELKGGEAPAGETSPAALASTASPTQNP